MEMRKGVRWIKSEDHNEFESKARGGSVND